MTISLRPRPVTPTVMSSPRPQQILLYTAGCPPGFIPELQNHVFSKLEVGGWIVQALLEPSSALEPGHATVVTVMTQNDPGLPTAFRINCNPLSVAFKALHGLVSAYLVALPLPLFHTHSRPQLCREPHPFILSAFGPAVAPPRPMPTWGPPADLSKLDSSVSCPL